MIRRLMVVLALIAASGFVAGAQTITLKRSSLRIQGDSIQVRGSANRAGLARMRIDPKLSPALAARCGLVLDYFNRQLETEIDTGETDLLFNFKKLPIPSPAHYQLIWLDREGKTAPVDRAGTEFAEVRERAQQYVCPQAPGTVPAVSAIDTPVRSEIEKSVVSVTVCADADIDGCTTESGIRHGSGFFVNGAGWVVTAAKLVKGLASPSLRIEIRRHRSQSAVLYTSAIRQTASGNEVAFPAGHSLEDQLIVLKPQPGASLGAGVAFLDPIYSSEDSSGLGAADRLWVADLVNGEVKTRAVSILRGTGAKARERHYSEPTDRLTYRCQECAPERVGSPILDGLGRVWGVYVGATADANPARREFNARWAHDIVTWFIERAR